MAVFTPLLIAIFAFPQLAKGPLGWVALITGLLGIGICVTVRFLLKADKKDKPDYLPDEEEADEEEAAKQPQKAKGKKPGKSGQGENETQAESESTRPEGSEDTGDDSAKE